MASSEADGNARPSVDEEEPPTKQLKLCVEDYQFLSSNFGRTDTYPLAMQTASEDTDGVLIPDHSMATLDNVLQEDGSNLVARVEDSKVATLEGPKTKDLNNSGTLVAQVTELDASSMVIDAENVGIGDVGILETEEARVQMAENEQTTNVSTSEVLEGNAANGLHVAGTAITGVPTAPIVGLPFDLGAGTSAVQRTKTSLCSYFRKKGCRHGAACRYAHGEEELKPRPDGSWDPTSERAKALLLQMSAASPYAVSAAAADPTVAEEVHAAPAKAPAREETEESTVNPLSKCIVHVPRGWSVDHFKKFLTENDSVGFDSRVDPNAQKGKGGWRGRANWKGMSNVGQARQRVKKMPPSEPFRPVKAIAVDLFPHTVHCEMVMLFER